MGQIIYSSTEPRFPDTGKVTRDKILQAIVAGAGSGGGGGTPAPSYLLSENFEAAVGYDNVGWSVNSGTPNPDYTTTVLEGTQSLLMSYIGAGTNQRLDAPTLATQTDIWAYFLYRPLVLPAGFVGVASFKPSGASLMHLQITSTGAIRAVGNFGSATPTTSVMSVNTTYHVWMHFKAGTGANGIQYVAFSTNGIRPTIGNNVSETTTTAETNTVDRMRFWAEGGTTWSYIVDKLRINNVEIGDNPV